jgi:hypothetical protein
MTTKKLSFIRWITIKTPILVITTIAIMFAALLYMSTNIKVSVFRVYSGTYITENSIQIMVPKCDDVSILQNSRVYYYEDKSKAVSNSNVVNIQTNNENNIILISSDEKYTPVTVEIEIGKETLINRIIKGVK